tara:strand:- start:1322 stop:1660 length:339 start_codon:yes stop_codon:yes gene_type:complete
MDMWNDDDYPVIRKIKMRMKNKEGVKIDQIKGYNRRLKNSLVFQVHIELLQEIDTRRIRVQKLMIEKDKEIKHLNDCLTIQAQRADRAEQFLIDTFGKKSWEYEQYQSFVGN